MAGGIRHIIADGAARTGRGRLRARALGATASVLLTLSGAVNAAQADLPPIGKNDHIVNSLLAAAIGDEIRKNCPTISARMLKVLYEANKLKRYALDQGYSEAEIEAFLDSRAEKDAMQARRDAYLAANGVARGNADSYCALGRKEIARRSVTGSLLRAH